MMNHKRYTRHTKWFVLLGIGLWAGCSALGDDPEQPAPESETGFAPAPVVPVEAEEVEPVVLHDHIYEIDHGAHIDFGDGVWTVPVADAGDLAQRQVGDVLVVDVEPQQAKRITSISESGSDLIIYGEEPEITDVIKHGKFQVLIPAHEISAQFDEPTEDRIIDIGGTPEFSQRQQELSYTHDFSDDIPQPPDFGYDFSHELFQYTNDSATVSMDMDAGVDFKPSLIAEVEISFSDIAARVELIGHAEAWANFDIYAEESFTYERGFTIPITDYTIDIDPPILDPFVFTLEAFLRGDLRVTGYGAGEYNPEFSVTGDLRAGVTQGLSSGTDTVFDHGVVPSAEVGGDKFDLSMEGNVQFGLDAGVAMYRGSNTSGNKLAEAVPLSANFSANGQIQTNPPICPYDIKLTIDSFARTFDPGHRWDARHVTVDRDGDIPAPGCQSENDPAECVEDIDCRDAGSPGANVSGASMACEDTGGTGVKRCVPAADLNVSMNWTSEANLNLYVTTPDGETLSYANPGPNSGMNGQMYQTSCGGCEESGGNYVETALHDGSTSSDVFYIWVENPDGFHDGDSSQDISFTLNVNHGDTFDETFYGMISGEEGSKSMTYRYTVPAGGF